MALSDSQKRARNKWDYANMVVIGCKVRKDKAEQFKVACASAGTSPNAVFCAAIESFLASHPGGIMETLAGEHLES